MPPDIPNFTQELHEGLFRDCDGGRLITLLHDMDLTFDCRIFSKSKLNSESQRGEAGLTWNWILSEFPANGANSSVRTILSPLPSIRKRFLSRLSAFI